jgi:hypothetical protein
MSEKQSTRKYFLQFLGLSAGAAMISTTALASMVDATEIRKLNSRQQAFMIPYGKWMNEFMKVATIKKTDPGNKENNKKMANLAIVAEKFKPDLTEFMKDETFRLIYKASIERITNEI